MKIIHTADWHIGKQLNNYSLLEDQIQIFHRWIDEVKERQPDIVLISGDLYDISRPGRDSTRVVNELLSRMATEWDWPVVIINGNHDSGAMVGYGQDFFAKQGIYVVGTPSAEVFKISVGDADIYPLAFDYAPTFKKLYDDPEIVDIVTATERQVAQIKTQWDPDRQNILLYHGSVSAEREGEDLDIADARHALSVGTVEYVPTAVFEGFDYVALGHIHGMQRVGKSRCYYSGSPLTYSKNEAKQNRQKGYLEIDIDGDDFQVTEHPIAPIHAVRIAEDTLENLLQAPVSDDYIYFNLTDKTLQSQAMARLKQRFPNAMGVTYVKEQETVEYFETTDVTLNTDDPMTLIAEFYQYMMDDQPLSNAQQRLLTAILTEIAEEED